MTIAAVTSTILTNAEPGAGAEVTGAQHDFGAALIRGLWVYTDLGASAFDAAPTNGLPRIRTTLEAVSSSGGTASDRDPPISFEHSTPADDAYHFADYWAGQVPRYVKLTVLNLTNKAVSSNKLSVTVECVKET